MINRSLISGVQPQLGHASRLLRSRLLLPPITLPPRLSWGPGAASLSLTPCGADTDSASVAMSRSPLTLLVILSLLGGCASKLAVETDASPMRAKVGDNVVLKCQFSVARPPVDLSQLVVQWFHRGGQLVEFDNVVSGSRPGANLSMEGLRSGNAALYLSKVTLESAGNYRCYITYMHDMRIKQVVLHVEGKAAGPPGGLLGVMPRVLPRVVLWDRAWGPARGCATGPARGHAMGPAMGSCHRLANTPLALQRAGNSHPQPMLPPHSRPPRTELPPPAHSAPCWPRRGLQQLQLLPC
ncbi:uncharacterized protein LOC119857454 isoform X4 [Dermochelys coriacea]|uniref:uncharacterized protein LOC119857454 isoform X4 n=1 Tax=Dermochelys coriacea TaxID=27794 RepID=UPI001CA8D864|nr:uncharacterized protein LOC119857454 isoform X4 [Dermochelys coriacea]